MWQWLNFRISACDEYSCQTGDDLPIQALSTIAANEKNLEEIIEQEQKRPGNCDSGEVIEQIFDQPFLNAIYKTRKVLDTVNCQTVGERQR